jgi:NAD(P)-dependent dehydrogenase (short-subunit alcohol dehydrogenase family)
MTELGKLFDLTGKVALVTGGSRGLGEEMAEGLAEAGSHLMLLARREQWLSPAVEAMKRRGFRCEGMLCDVSKPDQVKAAVEKTVEVFGRIDILINNAGVSWGAPPEEMPLDKWQMVIDVNLTGAFLFSQAAAAHMIRQKYGRIVNVASISGLLGSLSLQTAGYVASKGGLISLTRDLAAAWADHNIRVNAIAPGFFPSRMTEKVLPRMQEYLTTRVPMRRAGVAGELKGVAVFLAADASNYITGQTIVVDGGVTAV